MIASSHPSFAPLDGALAAASSDLISEIINNKFGPV